MNRDMEAIDEADPGLEERLHAYYRASYGETELPHVAWQSIATQLGNQEAIEIVKLDGSTDKSHARNGYAVGDEETLREQSEAGQLGRKQQRL